MEKLNKNFFKWEYVSYSARDFALPKRSTEHSAGYDIHSPINIKIKKRKTVIFPLDIKAKIPYGYVLLILPRSSMGFNDNYITLTNTIGVIDADYYNNKKNEGCIAISLHNFGKQTYEIKKNDKIAQAILVKYSDVLDKEVPTQKRNGGIGSTGK